MPIDRSRYPPDWDEISYRIRFIRAGGRCEVPGCGAEHGQPHWKTGKKVKLQTAHLNRKPEETTDDMLMALCARCHFAYDRADNQWKKHYGKRASIEQLEIDFENEKQPVSHRERAVRIIHISLMLESIRQM